MALQLIQLVWHISVEPLAPFPPQSTFLIYVLTFTHFFPATIAALPRKFQIFTLCVTLFSPLLERAEKKNLLSSSTGKEENLFCQRFTLFSSSFINNPSRKFPPPPWTRNLCHSGVVLHSLTRSLAQPHHHRCEALEKHSARGSSSNFYEVADERIDGEKITRKY